MGKPFANAAWRPIIRGNGFQKRGAAPKIGGAVFISGATPAPTGGTGLAIGGTADQFRGIVLRAGAMALPFGERLKNPGSRAFESGGGVGKIGVMADKSGGKVCIRRAMSASESGEAPNYPHCPHGLRVRLKLFRTMESKDFARMTILFARLPRNGQEFSERGRLSRFWVSEVLFQSAWRRGGRRWDHARHSSFFTCACSGCFGSSERNSNSPPSRASEQRTQPLGRPA